MPFQLSVISFFFQLIQSEPPVSGHGYFLWVYIYYWHMVPPLSWCDGLSTSMTQRATPAGAYAPGRATHAGQVKG